VIIWNRVVKGVPYINPEGYLFLDQKRKELKNKSINLA
jgi:transposase